MTTLRQPRGHSTVDTRNKKPNWERPDPPADPPNPEGPLEGPADAIYRTLPGDIMYVY
jgi:hypothetical protein